MFLKLAATADSSRSARERNRMIDLIHSHERRPWALPRLVALALALWVPGLAAAQVLLPAQAHYARNASCAPAALAMPPGRHTSVDGDDLSPRPSQSPLSQGDVAICFAYATADMISQRVGAEVSPLDVATKYYFAPASRLAKIRDPRLEAHLRRMGDWRAAIDASRATAEVTRENNPKWLPFVDKLEGGEEETAALLYNVDGLCEDADLPSFDGYTHFFAYFHLLHWRLQTFPAKAHCSARLGDLAENLRNPETDAFNEAWLDRVERQCHRRALPTPLLPINFRVARSEADFMEMLEKKQPPTAAQVGRMLAMIDYALDHERAPVIGYSWYILEEMHADDFDLAADHASAVIARRKVDGVCQYRVQDNTGEYCGRMRPEISARCENGRVWLTERELTKTLYSVTYLR
jgi:hypothetical protein